MYIEILKAPSVLSLTLQCGSLDIIGGINAIITTLLSLSKQDPLLWPQVKLVLTKVSDDGTEKVYQGCELNQYSNEILKQCSAHAKADLDRLDVKIRERLQWSGMKLLRSILIYLDTRSWSVHRSTCAEPHDPRMKEISTATDYILSLFRAPLEAKGACLSSFNDQLEEIVTYARKYLDTENEDHKKIWYKLHVTSESKNWLLLCELLFSLPFTTSGVERAFLKLTDRRSSLLITTLNDLLEINTEGPALENFSSSAAVDLWWADCLTRVPGQDYLLQQSKELLNQCTLMI